MKRFLKYQLTIIALILAATVHTARAQWIPGVATAPSAPVAACYESTGLWNYLNPYDYSGCGYSPLNVFGY